MIIVHISSPPPPPDSSASVLLLCCPFFFFPQNCALVLSLTRANASMCENEAAKKSLQFFRGQNYDVSEEFNEIQQKHESKQSQRSKNWWKFTIKKIFSSTFFKPFSCIGIVFALNEWLGFGPLMTYLFEIFDETGSSFDLGIGLIVIASIRVMTAGMNFYFAHFTNTIGMHHF